MLLLTILKKKLTLKYIINIEKSMKKTILLLALILPPMVYADYKLYFKNQPIKLPEVPAIVDESPVGDMIFHYDMENASGTLITNKVTGSDSIDTTGMSISSGTGINGSDSLYIGIGDDTYLNIDTIASSLQGNGNFTISFYAKSVGYDSFGILFQMDRQWNTGDSGFQIMRAGSRSQEFELIYNSSINPIGIYPDTNKYQHFVVQREDGTIKMYIDKIKVYEGSVPESYSLSTGNRWGICGGIAGDNSYSCYLDDLKVYDFALLESDISSL